MPEVELYELLAVQVSTSAPNPNPNPNLTLTLTQTQTLTLTLTLRAASPPHHVRQRHAARPARPRAANLAAGQRNPKP